MQISVAHIIFQYPIHSGDASLRPVAGQAGVALVPGKETDYEEMRLHYLDERILQTRPSPWPRYLKEVERMSRISLPQLLPRRPGVLQAGQKSSRQQIRQE